MNRRCTNGLTVDTNVVLDYVEPEASAVGGRSQRLFDALFKRRVRWVTNQWLQQELNKKLMGADYSVAQADAVDDLRQRMNERGLLYAPGRTRDDDLRARLLRCENEREHDIQVIETALASPDKVVCSDDDKAGLRLCGLAEYDAQALPELSDIIWIDLRNTTFEPAEAVRGECTEHALGQCRLSLGHPLNTRRQGRKR